MKSLFALLFVVSAVGCTQSDHAIKVLQENGFKNIQITGWSPFSCSQDDTFKTGFTATSVTGAEVSGTVCEGLVFKNATIRFK